VDADFAAEDSLSTDLFDMDGQIFWIAEGGEGNFWKETEKNKKEISKKKSSDRKGQITKNVVSQKDQNTSSDDWGRWHFVQHWCDCTDGEPEPGVFMRCLSIWYLTFRAMFGACHKPAAFPEHPRKHPILLPQELSIYLVCTKA
jgi:hypothetical protein